MKSEKEVKKMGYPELQKYAAELETELGIDIDRSTKKVELLKAVLNAMTEAPDAEETIEPEETVEETVEEEVETKPSKRAKWIATKKYSDWESGIEFDPTNPDKNQPFEIKSMTSGLKNAMAKGIIVRAEK